MSLLPKLPPHRPSAAIKAAYQDRVAAFCDIFHYIQTAEHSYTPISFWNDLDVFVQMATEKSNLRNLFQKVCAEFCMPIANVGGWGDLNVRAGFMRRFQQKEAQGK